MTRLTKHISGLFLLLGAALVTPQDTHAMQQATDSLSAVNPYGGPNVLRTNLLYWGALTPNLGFNARMGTKWSLGLNVGFNPFTFNESKDKKWKHLLVAPELRFWNDTVFKPRTSYWGLNLIYSHYNVSNVRFPFGLYKSVRDARLQGDLAAIGAFYGYTWRLSKLFRMEAEIGLGVGYAWAKEYDCGHCGEYRGRDNKPFLVPKLALNLVLDKKKAAPVVVPAQPDIVEQPDFGRKQDSNMESVAVSSTPVGSISLSAAEQLKATNSILSDYKYYKRYTRTRSLRRDSTALFVYFPVDKAELSRDYWQNAAVLDRVVDVTRQVMADSMSRVRLIQIVGLASIEGPVDRNEQLAQQRAEALRDYLKAQVPGLTDQHFELNNGGEAWADLRDQLEEAGMIDVVRTINSEPDADRREQLLRTIDGGKTYDYVRQLLLRQRNAGYLKVYFSALRASEQ